MINKINTYTLFDLLDYTYEIEFTIEFETLYKKILNNESLSKQQLTILYEIIERMNSGIYEYNDKIEEILKSRNIRKDLAVIFDCNENNISFTMDEALSNENIVLHYGNYDLSRALRISDAKFPKYIRGDFDLRKLTSLQNSNFPEKIGGDIRLGSLQLLDSNCTLRFPKKVVSLDLGQLNYGDNIEFPEEVMGNLYLNNIESSNNLKLQKK